MTQIRDIRRSVLSANDRVAEANGRAFRAAKLSAINIMAAPGAGKTSLIERLLAALPATWTKGVIEGDLASSIDTERIVALGYPAVQINTGGGCHLEARQVGEAFTKLALTGPGVLFIENIGNLVCPVAWKLGEHLRLVIASVAEGDDKPHKYPAIFAGADLVVLTKTDLKEAVGFRDVFFLQGLRAVTEVPCFPVSSRNGEGVAELAAWLVQRASPGQA